MASSVLSSPISGDVLCKHVLVCPQGPACMHGKPLTFRGKSYQQRTRRSLSVCAKYDADRPGTVGDFVAGFLIGGAIFGVIGYVFAPQDRVEAGGEEEGDEEDSLAEDGENGDGEGRDGTSQPSPARSSPPPAE